MRAAIVLVLILGGLHTAEGRCPASVTTDTFAARGSFALGMRVLSLVDATGSGSDLIRVKVYKA